MSKQILTQDQIWTELRHAGRSSTSVESCVLSGDSVVKLQQTTQALAAVNFTDGRTGYPIADALMRTFFVVELSELFNYAPQVSLTKKNHTTSQNMCSGFSR